MQAIPIMSLISSIQKFMVLIPYNGGEVFICFAQVLVSQTPFEQRDDLVFLNRTAKHIAEKHLHCP